MLKPCSLPDSLRPILTKAGKQRGAATLFVAIILLLALTIVTFSAARIGVSEQRNSANDMRSKQAMEVALAGLEHGLAYLEKNRPKISSTSSTAPVGWMQPGSALWVACGASNASPCGDGATNIYGTVNPQVGGRNGNWLAYASVGDVNAVQFPPGNKYKYDVSYLTPGFDIDPGPGVTLGPDNNPIIIIFSTATPTPDATTGVKDPLAGSASARMTVRGYSTLMNIPAAPLMAKGAVVGAVTSGGNPTGALIPPCSPATQNPVSVITTITGSPPPPRGGSTTTPTSTSCGVSSSTTITTVTGNTMTTLTTLGTAASPTWVGGATRTSAWLPGVQCNEPFPGEALISPNAPACPPLIMPTDPRPFRYVFGVPDTKFQTIKDEFTPTTCSDLPTQPAGRYWVTGGCTLTSSTLTSSNVGTVDEPVILVVEDGDLTISGNIDFYGLIYVRDPNRNRTITLTGSADLYGALVSDRNIDIVGSFDVHYDYDILRKAGSTSGGGFAKLTGGWRDQLQP